MIGFGRRSSRYGRSPQPQTPYQRAGQAWDERIGAARVQARNWRLMAFGCLALATASTAAALWEGRRSAIEPWVVQVERSGPVEMVAPAEAGRQPTDPEIAWQLGRFIEEVRSLPADPVVLRQNWLSAYGFASGQAAASLNDYARRTEPFSAVGKEQVTAEIASVVRASPASFRVEWTENHYAGGVLERTERWTAILGVQLRPPHDPDGLRRNPLGVFVTALDWSKELSQ